MTGGPALFVVAGEPSGDLHGGRLLAEIARARPEATFRGFGGASMRGAGLECLADLPAEAIMGLFPVIASLPKIRRWFRTALEDLEANPPDALVVIDYPGFNLRLAAKAKALGIPVIYYISPQVWAWNRGRVKRIAKIVDLMLVILPFEEEFYRDSGVEVFYCGHPLADHLALTSNASRERHGTETPVVGVFPGSRSHVVDSLLETFLRAADRARLRHPELKLLVSAADDRLAETIRRAPLLSGLDHDVIVGGSNEVMTRSDVALTTSGTTTLELAGHECPMLIGYRVSAPFYAIGRAVIRVPWIGLVNLIADEGLVPEYVGVRSFHTAMGDDLADLLSDAERRDRMREGLVRVKEKLGGPGSYGRAAGRITRFLDERER